MAGLRNSKEARRCLESFGEWYFKMMKESMDIDSLSDAEDEEYQIYRGISKAYKEFSELSINLVAQMDEQSEMLEKLQEDMKILNRRTMLAMDTDQ